MISVKLLEELRKWELTLCPDTLFHGCRNTDVGIYVKERLIEGSKWFSVDRWYAGDYAWFNRNAGDCLCAKVRVSNGLRLVVRPSSFNRGDFPFFLKDCFPDIPAGYGLSIHFQNVLAEHLRLIYPDINVGYFAFDGSEIMIPNCEQNVTVACFERLPDSKEEYSKLKPT